MSCPQQLSMPSQPIKRPSSEMLSATLLGLALMVITTTWWWYLMR